MKVENDLSKIKLSKNLYIKFLGYDGYCVELQ